MCILFNSNTNMFLNKNSRSIMDEISENLRNTMLKYNEIELDKDLSIVQSIDGEESKFSNIIMSKESLNQMNKDVMPSDEKINQIGSLTPIKLNNSKQDMMSSRGGREYSRSHKEDSRCQLTFEQKAYRLINGLNDFEKQINNDFNAIEDMIEGNIDNELKNIKALI